MQFLKINRKVKIKWKKTDLRPEVEILKNQKTINFNLKSENKNQKK